MPATTPLQDGRFLLLQALGRGGMGSVYRAYDRERQRLVALKVADDQQAAGPAHPLAAEFETWSRLRHANVVRAYEMGTARNGPIAAPRPYLVLEHVRGRALHRWAELPPAVSALHDLARQLLHALDHVHTAGYVHRDVKPANVLVDPGRRRFLLTDFGLAAQRGCTSAIGSIGGSLPYLAPESLLGLPLDGRADLYALGILLFRVAVGRLPAERHDADSVLRWHLDPRPADPTALRPELAGSLADLIRRLTARERRARPQSAAAALQLLGSEEPPRPRDRTGEADSAERTRLRLALDAVRLGAHRVFRPSSRGARLTAEAGVWAQVRGMRFFRLNGGGCTELCKLVLRLLADRGGDGLRCIRQFGLSRSLPIGLVGGLPLLDPGGARRLVCDKAGHAVARFILECATERAMVLALGPAREDDALVSETRRRLTAVAEAGGPCNAGRGGLLVLLESAAAGRNPQVALRA